MGEWRYSSTILDLGIKWKWMVSFTPQPLYLRRKSARYPLGRRPGNQSRSGRCGERKKYFSCLESNNGYPACSPSLYRLSYPDSSRYLKRRKIAKKEKTKCRLVRSYYVSDEFAASIFRVGLKMRAVVFCENFLTLPKYTVSQPRRY
jgi:hypothetical protein